MDAVWTELYHAAKAVLNPRKVSEMMEAGSVAAAIEAGSGKSMSVFAWIARVRWASAQRETLFSI